MATAPELLTLALAAAVPLRLQQLQAQGGPTPWDVSQARETGQLLAEKGDVLLFGGRRGEAAGLFNRLVHALAVLAFCPDGIHFCGRHWEAT